MARAATSAPAPGPCDPPSDAAVTGVAGALLTACADGDDDRQRLLYVPIAEPTADGRHWAVTAAAPVDGAPPTRTA